MRQLWQVGQTVLGLIFRHPLTGVSVVPILPDGRIVLVRRRDNNKYALPGGMVEWGEDVTTTVKRELFEETGLELVKIRRLVGVYSAPDRDPRVHSINILVEADVRGNMNVQDTLEISDVQAFEVTSLPDNLSYDYDLQLKDYFTGLTILA
ncbi:MULTISPECIES: NUDIX domain-containing protein [Okeania]|uniref:NUDIX hydrolase n=1 Tax=Okeania hirsuta TaxID=1458930 RepID=A0A3N6NKR0_9CYAN|nr:MULTISPECIES: NUDIX hydrolase [Okeania]NEP04422.1 NUDIX hydrolase [Okeania sp. SIO4D6]NET12613.1 NUDIX hydrolase [Okeania sp. SIO1H6]NEP75491.1 NUDIX hydrolase [Okeania sp. SIO2G5]NEP95245.1 NUDIX hydrolase [Okeania sp. SIO2F5]NEQ93744.1 NUDIX hydrolase [Okeania sp. SIO2G4]